MPNPFVLGSLKKDACGGQNVKMMKSAKRMIIAAAPACSANGDVNLPFIIMLRARKKEIMTAKTKPAISAIKKCLPNIAVYIQKKTVINSIPARAAAA